MALKYFKQFRGVNTPKVEISHDEALKVLLGSYRDNDMTREMLTMPNEIPCMCSTVYVEEERKEKSTMKKITYKELWSIMNKYNKEHPDREGHADITGVIVYKESNWEKPFTEKERSYRVANSCREFQDGKISSQLSGDCLDGKDLGVRLDWYRWEVDYCYMD